MSNTEDEIKKWESLLKVGQLYKSTDEQFPLRLLTKFVIVVHPTTELVRKDVVTVKTYWLESDGEKCFDVLDIWTHLKNFQHYFAIATEEQQNG